MKKMKFIRFGGLSSVKHELYDTSSEKSFHNPPRKNGIYAFPFPYIETFLLGSTREPWNSSNKSQWLKDDNGNRINFYDFYDTSTFDLKTGEYKINPKYISLLKKLNIRKKDLGSCMDKKSLSILNDENLNIEQTKRDDLRKNHLFITVLKKPKIFEHSGEIWSHLEHQLKPEHIIETSGSWVKTDLEDYLYALKKEIHETKKYYLKDYKEFNIPLNTIINNDPYKKYYSKDHLEVFIEIIK